MGGLSVLFDTNILIDYLQGVEDARLEIERHPGGAISAITWMEVLAGSRPEEESETRRFLARFELCPITLRVAERVVVERRQHRLKLPDAIMLATAEVHHRMLMTRNTNDFDAADPRVHIPYRL